MKAEHRLAAESRSSGLLKPLPVGAPLRDKRDMHTTAPAPRPAEPVTGLPKFDQKLTVRLDTKGMEDLERLAANEFLDPAIYARQILLKHIVAARTSGTLEAA